MTYSESEEYQTEISDQYKKRTATFSKAEVVEVFRKLGFLINENEIIEAEAGNVHATFITNDFVIKITKEKGRGYLPNKIVSDFFSDGPVVQVAAHDIFDKTPYEVLVMKKSPGELLQKEILQLDKNTIEQIFMQVLDVVTACSFITSKTYGFVANPETKYDSFKAFQMSRISHYFHKIRTEKLAEETDVTHIENYFHKHVHVLDEGQAVLIHRDLHAGNILFKEDSLTAVIDWDSALYAPLYAALPSLFGFIDNPSQFVEGTSDYQKFKNVNFRYLLPIVKDKLSQVFADQNLVLKLNLCGIVECLMWVSQNWSENWNKEMIEKLVTIETPDKLESLRDTYYGKLLS